jgi:hypothetical protein
MLCADLEDAGIERRVKYAGTSLANKAATNCVVAAQKMF